MSIIRKMFHALVVISVLAFQSVSHAETPEVQEGQPGIAGVVVESAGYNSELPIVFKRTEVNLRELQCLARNIFYEAATEPEEGKVAVGLVTMNRLRDGRFGRSICQVIDQKTVFQVPKQITVRKKTLFKTVEETHTIYTNRIVCQFSWRCTSNKTYKKTDNRWVESQRIARELLEDEENFSSFRTKYSGALYFHATHIRPSWAHQKVLVGKIGGHRFYREQSQAIAMR